MNLKKKNFYTLTLQPICVQTNYWKLFRRFLPFATCVNDIGSAHWAANISENSQWPFGDTQGLGRNWFMKKTWSRKSRDTVPLKGREVWRLVHVLPELLLVHPGLLVLPPLLLLLLPLQVLHPLLHTEVKALLWGLITRQYLVGPLTKGKPELNMKCTRYSFFSEFRIKNFYSTPCRILW